MSVDLITRLIEAGTPAALVAEVATELARAKAEAQAMVDAANQPSNGALRTRRWRERHAASQSVTCDAGDARVTENVTAPSLSPPPSLSPQTPQTLPPPHSHPEQSDAYARKAAEIALAIVVAGCASAIVAQRAKQGGWPVDMPPPPNVTDAQWTGFIAHRKAKRQQLTQRAYDLLCGKLRTHSCDEWPPGRIIDTIVDRGWLSFERAWLDKIQEPQNGRRNGAAIGVAGNRQPGGGRSQDGFLNAIREAADRG